MKLNLIAIFFGVTTLGIIITGYKDRAKKTPMLASGMNWRKICSEELTLKEKVDQRL